MKNYLLGNISLAFLLAFYVYSILGVILSMLYHYTGKHLKDKKKNKHKRFSLKFWIIDNLVRFLTSVITIFIIVRFYGELHISYELNMFVALLIGVSLDRVIIFIRNKTQINIFQNDTKN